MIHGDPRTGYGSPLDGLIGQTPGKCRVGNAWNQEAMDSWRSEHDPFQGCTQMIGYRKEKHPATWLGWSDVLMATRELAAH